MSEHEADATQADADAQSQADTTTETRADSETTISLDEAKKLRAEAASLRKRVKEADSKAQAAENAQKDREEAEAKDKGEWEKLAKKREEELEDLRKQLAQRDTTERRAAIAKKHGIPDDLISLLQGETDDDIEASAKIVAKHVKQREAPETDAGERTPAGAKKADSKKKEADFSSPSYWGLRQR